MKNYKRIIVILAILFSFTWNMDAAFEKRENRVSNNRATNNASQENGQQRINPPTDVPETGPVGDALPFLLGLGLIYGIYVFGKKKTTSSR